MPFFESDSIIFHYLDAGQGIPFLFQHGLGGDTHQTRDIFPDEPPFRLLTLDCRGHGDTRPLGSPGLLCFDQFSDDMLALLDLLDLAQVVVGGISMGAGAALNFALSYPRRVKALALVRPAWLAEPGPANLHVYLRIAELIRKIGPVRGRKTFRRSKEFLEIQRNFPAAAASMLKQFERPRAAECVDILDRIPRDAPNRSPEIWTRINVPTLVLANRRDPVHPFHYGEVLAGAIPGAVLKEITSKEVDAQRHNRDVRQALEGFLADVS